MGVPAGTKPDGRAMLAGGISGAIEICITYPIEYTKTMQQLSDKKLGIGQIVQTTLKDHGVRGMYRGMSSMLYFAIPKAAFRFTAFDFFNRNLKDTAVDRGSLRGFLAGLGAGTVEALLVTTPQETLKIKLIHDQFISPTRRFHGFFHGVSTIIREDGLRQVYRGVVPTVLKVSTAQATRFGVFQAIPAKYREGPVRTALSGAFAGFLSVIAFHGIDVVKSRMQGLEAYKYKGSLDCARQLYKEGGVAALYKGVVPRLARVCCEVAITFTLYDQVAQLLNTISPR